MSASKRKGTAWEVAIRDHLNANGIPAFRTAPAGARDEGDLLVLEWDAIVEAKATKNIDLAGAVTEAKTEAANAKRRFGIAVIKRRMASVGKAYVVMELDDFIDLLEKP